MPSHFTEFDAEVFYRAIGLDLLVSLKIIGDIREIIIASAVVPASSGTLSRSAAARKASGSGFARRSASAASLQILFWDTAAGPRQK